MEAFRVFWGGNVKVVSVWMLIGENSLLWKQNVSLAWKHTWCGSHISTCKYKLGQSVDWGNKKWKNNVPGMNIQRSTMKCFLGMRWFKLFFSFTHYTLWIHWILKQAVCLLDTLPNTLFQAANDCWTSTRKTDPHSSMTSDSQRNIKQQDGLQLAAVHSQ